MKRVTVAKSVRLSPEDVAYIESLEGRDFTGKLSGLLEEYRKGSEKRAAEVSYYEKLIDARRGELEGLNSLLYCVSRIRGRAVSVEAELDRIYGMLRKERSGKDG